MDTELNTRLTAITTRAPVVLINTCFLGSHLKPTQTHRQTHIHSLLIQWPASTSALIGRRLNQSELARSGPAGDDTFGKPYQVWVAICNLGDIKWIMNVKGKVMICAC